MRKDFLLPDQDMDYLSSIGLPWETYREANINWVFIHDFPVPEGYLQNSVTVALMIQPGYPVGQIDMAYFFPHLQLKSQKGIGALSFQPIDGKVYQRWSRHRTGSNPWRPGIDDLSTHMSLVSYWFQRELQK